MTGKEKRDVYQEVTDSIIASLENGTVPWQRPWTTAGGPVNIRSGRPYRGINIFLLELMGYGDSRWGTFNAVKASGGQVRKGEKATSVVLWKPYTVKVDGEDERRFFLRFYSVFNAQQCDGLPELETEERAFSPVETAEAIVKGYGNRPPIHYGKSGAWYAPLTDTIGMPDAEDFVSVDAFYSTLFHELTHSTGSDDRLKRGLAPGYDLIGYSKEELVAQMGAAMLSGVAGIDPRIEQSASYIESWLKALANDKKLVVQAAAQAQKAADYMLGTTFEETTNDEATAPAAVA